MNKRVRAIIMQNDSILLIHRIKKDDEYWVFPGGGIEKYNGDDEKLALKRECKEELGVTVEVGDFFEKVVKGDTEEMFYFCTVTGGNIGTGNGPEFKKNSGYKGSHAPEWIPLQDFSSKRILPETIKQKLERRVL